MNKKHEWLIGSDEPWTRYRAEIDLLGRKDQVPECLKNKAEMAGHPLVEELIRHSLEWGNVPFKRHNDASYPIYMISTLADFGLDKSDSRIDAVCRKILEHVSADGGILTKVNIPKAFGGSGNDEWTWIICDMPTLVYSLLAFGYGKDKKVQDAVNLLAGLPADNGWGCSCHPDLGKFKGPGRKSDPCPVVNVYALKALSLVPELQDSQAVRSGTEMLLAHWEKQKEAKYYLFGIGTDYRKIKYPYVWYNILHVLEVLSRFPAVHADRRYQEMLAELESMADGDGRYTASSMYRSWKGWSFADKKKPSPWLTFLAERILYRTGSVSG